jgi:hypothetical protein
VREAAKCGSVHASQGREAKASERTAYPVHVRRYIWRQQRAFFIRTIPVPDQWKLDTQGIIGDIGLEIWGRTFLMGEPTDRITEHIESLARPRQGASLVH